MWFAQAAGSALAMRRAGDAAQRRSPLAAVHWVAVVACGSCYPWLRGPRLRRYQARVSAGGLSASAGCHTCTWAFVVFSYVRREAELNFAVSGSTHTVPELHGAMGGLPQPDSEPMPQGADDLRPTRLGCQKAAGTAVMQGSAGCKWAQQHSDSEFSAGTLELHQRILKLQPQALLAAELRVSCRLQAHCQSPRQNRT
jgi:hypothetical protein